MNYEILYRPSFSLLKVHLEQGDSVSAEAGAMVSMSGNIQMDTKMGGGGGFLGAIKKTLGGESFFMNSFSSPTSPGDLYLAPTLGGDIWDLELSGETIFAQSGSYIASTPGINIDSKWGGFKGLFSGQGLVMLKISGNGHLFLSSYGALHEITLEANQKYIVDNGHLVSFTKTVTHNIKKVGGLKSTLFSGEGFVMELTGPGKVIIQSRNQFALLSWIKSKMGRR